MIAYYLTLVLLTISLITCAVGLAASVFLKKIGKLEGGVEEVVTLGKKVITLIFTCLFIWLYYSATIGLSASGFAFGLFITHATTICLGTLHQITLSRQKVYGPAKMLSFLLVSLGYLSAYIYFGINYL